VQIAERKGGVVPEHVGTARTDPELAALMALARRRINPGQDQLGLGLATEGEGSSTAPAVITGKRSALLWQVLTQVYARLGFDAIDDEAFKELVLARLIEPTSKADTVRVLEEIGVPASSLRTILRSLARAQERDYRSTIAQARFAHASPVGDVNLCLHNVTTLCFEAEDEDVLGEVGYSKERRVDHPDGATQGSVDRLSSRRRRCPL